MAKPKAKPLVTPIGRFNFVHFDKPDSGRVNSDDKFKCDFLMDKESWKTDASAKELMRAVLEMGRVFYQDANKKLGQFAHPFKDGDQKDPLNPYSKPYEGMMYIIPKSEYKPTIYKADGVTEMTDEEIAKIKAGDWGRLVVRPYTYTNKGGGVTLGLQGVQFQKEGKSFGGGRAAIMDMLGPLEVELEDLDTSTFEEDEDEEDLTDIKL